MQLPADRGGYKFGQNKEKNENSPPLDSIQMGMGGGGGGGGRVVLIFPLNCPRLQSRTEQKEE